MAGLSDDVRAARTIHGDAVPVAAAVRDARQVEEPEAERIQFCREGLAVAAAGLKRIHQGKVARAPRRGRGPAMYALPDASTAIPLPVSVPDPPR